MVEDEREKNFIDAYEKYSEAIFRHCYYRVFDRDKAKDFVQEAFCRTWKYITEGNKIDNIRAFLYRIANNIIIDESRKKKSASLDTMMEKGFQAKIKAKQSDEDYFTAKEVVKMIKSLDEKYRDVITMKYVDDFSTKEIAEIIGETENNTYVRIHRGLEQLKKIVKKHYHQ